MVGIPASCAGIPDYEYEPGHPRQVFPDFFKYLLANAKATSLKRSTTTCIHPALYPEASFYSKSCLESAGSMQVISTLE
jgi:hypothetical protein